MRFLFFHIIRLSSSSFLFSPRIFPVGPVEKMRPGCSVQRASEAATCRRAASAWISFCVATLMSLMRVRSVSGFLTNSFLSNLLLSTTPFSISPLSNRLFYSFPVSSSRAFQSSADYFYLKSQIMGILRALVAFEVLTAVTMGCDAV